MSDTTNSSGEWIEIGDQRHELIYSMLSLEKIEEQFGSVAQMQGMITDDAGQVKLDRPVVKLLVDILHAGLLHVYDDTPLARKAIAMAMRPADLERIVEAFTKAFTASFGEMGEKAMEGEAPGLTVLNREERRAASHSTNGTTSLPSSSVARKKSGKK
jgi:hypothetical protein